MAASESCTRIRVNMVGPRYNAIAPIPNQPVMEVPKELDYDMWLGPAPWQPYTKLRCHASFRLILDYSGGSITDHGAHRFDIAQWGSDNQLTGPTEIEATGVFPKDGLFDTAIETHCFLRFPDGLLYEYHDDPDVENWKIRFEGDEGWIDIPMEAPLPHRPLTAGNPKLLDAKIGPTEERLPRSELHQRNFLDCVRTRQKPIAHEEIGHRSTTCCHLANIAMQLGRPLTWDPARERFDGDDDANAMIDRPKREPWTL